jgi:BON domain-containing protein
LSSGCFSFVIPTGADASAAGWRDLYFDFSRSLSAVPISALFFDPGEFSNLCTTSDSLLPSGFSKSKPISGVIMKSLRLSSGVMALVVLAGLAGCNKAPARNDPQVAADVQRKISSDAGVTSHEVGVQADHGVVTLSGNVASDEERASAASDAATVEGVRTVVNDLVVQQTEAAPTLAPETPEAPAPVKNTSKRMALSAAKADKHAAAALPIAEDNSNAPPTALPAAPSEPTAAQAPPPPPPPKKVTIAAGTQLTVRLIDTLDSERNQVGDSFHATLGAPIVIDDETAIPSGADVVGRVVDVKSAGRFAGGSDLKLELTSLSVNGKTYNIQSNQWSRTGKGEGKNTAVKAGGGAALGAIIGGLAGGGKGAAIGTLAGAGAGTGAAAATQKPNQIKLGPEATLSFLLTNTVTVTQQSSNNQNAGRTPLQ